MRSDVALRIKRRDVWTRNIFWSTLLVAMGRSHAQGVWTVGVSYGSCELSPDGMCVSDGVGDYINGESCAWRAETDIVVNEVELRLCNRRWRTSSLIAPKRFPRQAATSPTNLG
jgi:hypothetical protein